MKNIFKMPLLVRLRHYSKAVRLRHYSKALVDFVQIWQYYRLNFADWVFDEKNDEKLAQNMYFWVL